MDSFWMRFLQYRFDFAALAFDCVATFFCPAKRPIWRVFALIGGAAMLLPPVFVLVFGNDRFGNGWAFGLTLALFVVLIESPGYLWRKGVVNGGIQNRHAFDRFLFVLFSAIGVSAPLLLVEVDIHSTVLLGVLWGIALVGAQDMVRSVVAFFLALSHGRPVYG